MEREKLERLVEFLISLPTRQWATLRSHETRMVRDYHNIAVYTSLSEAKNNKNSHLLGKAAQLAVMQHKNFDVYCQVLQLIQSERAKIFTPQKRGSEAHRKAKHAEYQRTYRAKKSALKRGVDVDGEREFMNHIKKTQKLRDAGLPRPKSLTHAQRMKVELDAYIAAEEHAHARAGNVSANSDDD